MEHVLQPPPPAISLRDFLLNYQTKLPKIKEDVPFYFAAKSPVSKEVEQSCSLDLIALPDDNLIHPFQPGCDLLRSNVVKPQSNLPVPKTFTALTEHKSKIKRNAFSRIQYSWRLMEPARQDPYFLTDYELELTVRVYRPPRARHRGYNLESPVLAEEFVCLGRNYLTEFRDKISCICNGKQFVDISSEPDAPLPSLDTNPGYFFINNTFYNDKRNPENCDYSKTVIQWASQAHGLQEESFKVESMEHTRFIDLTVSLGSPLQYLHHGNCEHLFVISQVEVLTPQSKCVDLSLYPYKRAFNTKNRRPCYMCGMRSFNFIVEHSKRQLHDPAYLCRNCYFSFNYVNGEKVGEFKAYRIHEAEAESKEQAELKGRESPDSDVVMM